MPEDVRRAKHIRYKMTDKADLGCRDEETDEITGLGSTSGDDREETRHSLGRPPMPISPESSGEDGELRHPIPARTTTPLSLPSPRPLIAKRWTVPSKTFDAEDILTMMKMTMLHEQQRREEDARRREENEKEKERIREEEKQQRDEERREDQQRREHECKWQDQFFEAMRMVMPANIKRHSGKIG
ncbi:hypothetical protein BWQ96_06098 [Gracilariopsis chorda]|uniref:Uncharacterized protein n=1 Tax=Gracilariopsis chorda TaxID=448386 RepID=A0A2V3IPV9_9FLOR|nr:hypothetical protein BWQ96_06098 [Gracilariopsis chorda]|eukprot:PXF44125.1 hypothetical protein BWQ96_06098 [Gracilariopsis chorda]